MKIALVWNHTRRLDQLSFRFDLYAEGLRQLGHDPFLVCPRACAAEMETPLQVAETAEELNDAAFWRPLGVEVAIAITYHKRASMMAAMQQAGIRTIALSDSDGQVGLRAHPAMTLTKMWHYLPNWRKKLGCLKYFLGRYFLDGFRGQEEDLEFLRSTEHSDVVLFHSEPAIQCFRKFLRFHRREDLTSRLRHAPFAVPTFFTDHPLPQTKDDLIVAAGRWSDPQKDAPLLVGALDRLLKQRSQSRVEIFGNDADAPFGPLANRHRNLVLRGPQPLEYVRESLAKARVAVFSSRWETGPHVATEALSLGATLVGAPIPNLVGLTEARRFGRVARDRRPASLARALLDELNDWDAGQRSLQDIAEHWRPRLTPGSIGRQYLEALEDVLDA